jgi:hypothetical protein
LVRQRVEQCKDFQTVVADVINNYLVMELLAEGGMETSKFMMNKDLVRFKFQEIDTDEQIKWQNHIADMWAKDLITIEEARIATDLDPVFDENRMHVEIVSKKESEFRAAATAANRTDSVNRPTNQHGTKLSNPSTANDK